MHLTKLIALGQQARVTVRGGMFVAALMLAVLPRERWATAPLQSKSKLTAKGP